MIGRPYYLSFDVLDPPDSDILSDISVVYAAEIHEDVVSAEASNDDPRDEAPTIQAKDGEGIDVVDADGEYIIKNNRLTVDDSSRQTLTMEEIEDLKKAGSGSGKDIIAKIMESHLALGEKNEFSLAKYTLRKTRKYLRRFTVLPLDVSMLAHYLLYDKEPARIMELREETLGLMASWSNVHYSSIDLNTNNAAVPLDIATGRWLVADDTGGLVVAEMADRMGLLRFDTREYVDSVPIAEPKEVDATHETTIEEDAESRPPRKFQRPPEGMSANSNTITLIHSAAQPNLALLTYFGYDPSSSTPTIPPVHSHPLHRSLKTVSWLQLVSPDLDSLYIEPEIIPDSTLDTWKSGKRGTYHKKRRRWERTRHVVDETRAGGFDGLLVASTMSPISILHHLVPLLAGGAPVVVYSPYVEPLAALTDAYSTARKTAFIQALHGDGPPQIPNEDFSLDPRLLLAPSVQTARAHEWQVLPGRTHPLMTARGGPEGFVFTATRVLPLDIRVEARGRYAKKRKIATNGQPGVDGDVKIDIGDDKAQQD